MSGIRGWQKPLRDLVLRLAVRDVCFCWATCTSVITQHWWVICRLHSGQRNRVFTYEAHPLLMFCVWFFFSPPFHSKIVTALTKGLVWGSCRRFAGMLVAGETDLKLCVTDGRSSALQQASRMTGQKNTTWASSHQQGSSIPENGGSLG